MTTDLTAQEIEELKRLEKAADAGPWDSDTIETNGEYGCGEDTHSGFSEFVVYNAKGYAILSTEKSENGTVEVEYDEDGTSAWNENSRCNVTFSIAARNALPRLLAMVERLQEERSIAVSQLRSAGEELATLRRQIADKTADAQHWSDVADQRHEMACKADQAQVEYAKKCAVLEMRNRELAGQIAEKDAEINRMIIERRADRDAEMRDRMFGED